MEAKLSKMEGFMVVCEDGSKMGFPEREEEQVRSRLLGVTTYERRAYLTHAYETHAPRGEPCP
jgi:hypothetical protein